MTRHWDQDAEAAPVVVDAETLVGRIMVGETPAMRRLKRMIATLAPSDAPVLVQGPTGAGKELVAEALHRISGRRGPLVAVNCAAIPAELLEAELFGHEKGAFTGADRQRTGLIEQAAGGTLFLDEIGDMPLALQAKLLRVLESRAVQRVGGGVLTRVDFRLVSATHQALEQKVAEGKFRADLYFRLSVFPVTVPSLAERTDDIPLILSRMGSDMQSGNPAIDLPHFDASAIKALAAHAWPGNVRELKNVLMRAVVMFPGRMISARQVRENLLTMAMPDDGVRDAVPEAEPVEAGLPDPSRFRVTLDEGKDLDLRGYLRDIEVALIEAALDRRQGCVTRAADMLRLRRTTLIEKMKKFGVRRELAAEE